MGFRLAKLLIKVPFSSRMPLAWYHTQKVVCEETPLDASYPLCSAKVMVAHDNSMAKKVKTFIRVRWMARVLPKPFLW